jgi:hypothetical protein
VAAVAPAAMQRWLSLLLVAVCAVMALIKVYEQHERSRFMASHPVMVRMEHPPRWPEDDEAFQMPLTFETNFTAVSRTHCSAAKC